MKYFTKRLEAERYDDFSRPWYIACPGLGTAAFCPKSIKALFTIPKDVLVADLVITNKKPPNFEGVYVATMLSAHSNIHLHMPDYDWKLRRNMTWSADVLLYPYLSRPGPIYIWVEYYE